MYCICCREKKYMPHTLFQSGSMTWQCRCHEETYIFICSYQSCNKSLTIFNNSIVEQHVPDRSQDGSVSQEEGNNWTKTAYKFRCSTNIGSALLETMAEMNLSLDQNTGELITQCIQLTSQWLAESFSCEYDCIRYKKLLKHILGCVGVHICWEIKARVAMWKTTVSSIRSAWCRQGYTGGDRAH